MILNTLTNCNGSKKVNRDFLIHFLLLFQITASLHPPVQQRLQPVFIELTDRGGCVEVLAWLL